MQEMRYFLAMTCALAALIAGCKPSGSPGNSPQDDAGTGKPPARQAPEPLDETAPPDDALPGPSGIVSKVIKAGSGATRPGPSNVVVFHFSAWTTKGKLLDSSLTREEPVAGPLGRVGPGWIEALQLMVAGEKRRLWIPARLLPPGKLREAPGGMVVLDVELLDVRELNQPGKLSAREAGIVEAFNRLYARTHIASRNITWMGVEIQQNPCDCWMMQEIIWELRPDFIIETGTYTGGSALFYASVLDRLDPDRGKVITVDMNPMVDQVSSHRLFGERVEVIRGDSVSPEVINRIKKRIQGAGTVLVTLDSLHTKQHVLRELELYAPMVSKGSYIVVQDTHMDYFSPHGGPGPDEAVAEFLQNDTRFRPDRSRERLLLTYYGGGYLKRTE